MGFLQKIFGKKKVAKEEQDNVKLKFNETDKWINDETSGFLNSINKTIKDSFEKIKKVSKKLNTSIENLEKTESKGDVDDKSRIFALDNRTAFVRKVRALNNKIRFPDVINTFHVLEFYRVLINDINKLATETSKNVNFTNILFVNEVKEIKNNLRNLGIIANKSHKELHENKDKIKLIFNIRNNIQETKNLMNSRKQENDKLKDNELTLKKIHDEKKEVQETLNKLNQGAESTRLKQIQEQLNILNDEINDIKDNVLYLFSPLRKGLKKYERDSTGLNKDELKTLTSYTKSPFKAVLIDKDFRILDKILENLENLVNSGKINLKHKIKQKTLVQVNKLKDHSELNALLKKYKEKSELNKELKNKINGIQINKKIDLTKQKLRDIEKMIDNKKQEIHKLENSLNNIHQNISDKIKKLEKSLIKLSNKKVSIEFSS